MDLYLNNHMSDVIFYVGRTNKLETPVRFVAHKCVITFASPVFEKMLANDEFTEGKQGEIKIIDVTPTAFNALLCFAYTGKLSQHLTTEYHNILYAAEKYSMDNLKVACFQNLADEHINIDNFWSFWNITQNHFSERMSPSIVSSTKDFLSENALQILEKSEFENISRSLLSSVIESNFLISVQEIVIFNSVLRWAKIECCRQGLNVEPLNLTKVLGDVVYKIRYLLMSTFELKNGPLKSQILPSEDGERLLRGKDTEYKLKHPPWDIDLMRRPRELKREIRWHFDFTSTEVIERTERDLVMLAFACNVILSSVEFSVVPIEREVQIECRISSLSGDIFKIFELEKSYDSDVKQMISIDIPVCLKSFTGYVLTVVCSKGLLIKNKHHVNHFCGSNRQAILYIGEFPRDIADELVTKYWKSAFGDRSECYFKMWDNEKLSFVHSVSIQCI